MKRFYKLGLLLGFVSVVGIQGYMVEAATFMDGAGSRDTEDVFSQVGAALGCFQDDASGSPLAGADDDSSRLVDVVAGYMKAADGKSLHSLFYQPDVGAWQNLYRQVTRGKEFSTLDLIALLDTTKARIFSPYTAIERAVDTESYLYIPTLFDNAMQQIFAGCWGISDEPLEDRVIRNLKEVYGRVVSGMIKFDSDGNPGDELRNLIKSLEDKESGSSSTEQAHFAALQECAVAVVYSALEPMVPAEHRHEFTLDGFLDMLKKGMNIQLSQSSFERTLEHVGYQNPLVGIVCDVGNFNRIASRLRNFEDAFGEEFDQLDDGSSLSERKFFDLAGKLHEEGVNEAQIGREAFTIISRLDPKTQTDKVLHFIPMVARNLELWRGSSDSGKILSLTPADQDALLDLHAQALEVSVKPHERLRYWKSLAIKTQNRRTVFDPEKVILRIAAACETVTNIQDEHYSDSVADSISRELSYFYEYFLDLSAGSQQQFVESLSRALGRNRSVQEAGDEYKVWMDLCTPVYDYTARQEKKALQEARPALIEKTILSLELIDIKKEEGLVEHTISRLHRFLSAGSERQHLMAALRDDQRFKAFPADQREVLIATIY